MIEANQSFIGFIGILLQLAGAVLVGGLFFLLRAHARRRHYFRLWSMAWPALALGMLALVMLHLGMGVTDAVGEQGTWPLPAALVYVYLLARLTYLALLVAGTENHVRGVAPTPFLPVAIGLAAAYALVVVWLTAELQNVVVWQAPIAAVALAWCGTRLLRLAPSRRGVGTRLSGVIILGMALLWTLYFFAFTTLARDASALAGVPLVLVRYNMYADLLLHMMLASGMIVLLLEQAKRAVDDAHSQLAIAHDELRRAALYDSVTATLNRRAFAEGVGLEVARGQFGAVMMMDVDDLKVVNDEYGHSAGDALLRHLADSVRAELRPSDRIYRWGGDEFMLILPGADPDGAHARLRSVILRAAPLHLGPDGEPVRLAASLGSAHYPSVEELGTAIDTADASMYEDKARRKLARTPGRAAAT
jgi:diguanylate cyclase (GGDEF)-like protein